MDAKEFLLRRFAYATQCERDQWLVAGRDYAARLDRLPPDVSDVVAKMFASYGMTRSLREKASYRAGIDAVISPWYPKAGMEVRNGDFA